MDTPVPSHGCPPAPRPAGGHFSPCCRDAPWGCVWPVLTSIPSRIPRPTCLKGRDLISVEYEDPFSFAGTVAALGDSAVVLAPSSLREAVLAHLRGAAALTTSEGN